MTNPVDDIELLLDGSLRHQRWLVPPEGVPLRIHLAGHGERMTAFAIDIALMLGGILFLALTAGFLRILPDGRILNTLILFTAFIVRNCYFIHFELAWQGQTPGKRICHLRVINRHGGELTPTAIVARNLTREVEFFVPLTLLVGLDAGFGAWQQLCFLGWVLILAATPLWVDGHLRAGDIIAGTQVIAVPKRALLRDLSEHRPARQTAGYTFTPNQLAIYGNLELQVLEEILRRPQTEANEQLLASACQKIRRKIGWEETVPPERVREFLTAFYSAERAVLERGQLFGRSRASKNHGDAAGTKDTAERR